VPAEHVHELRVALCREDRERVPDRPEDEPRDPEAQAEPERRRHRAVDDCDAAGRATEQDWLGQRAVQQREPLAGAGGIGLSSAGNRDLELAGDQALVSRPVEEPDGVLAGGAAVGGFLDWCNIHLIPENHPQAKEPISTATLALKDGKVYYSWQAFAPTLADWIATTRQRLHEWGFNSAGGWSLSPQQLRLPAVIDLELGRRAKFHWFDPFSPDTERRMMALAREAVAPFRGSPYRIGYFSDNEVGWWAGALFVYYSMSRRIRSPSNIGWRCCAGAMTGIGRGSPRISCRRPRSSRGTGCWQAGR